MPAINCAPEFEQLHPAVQLAVRAIPLDQHYILALSGGLDSMALLYFALPYLQRLGAQLRVVHVHHGLSPHADRWAEHCLQTCQQLGLACKVARVVVTQQGTGLEAAARQARYQVFQDELQTGGTLLQGHHQNDQAETVLMRLLRGAGPEGLAGIPQQRFLAKGQLFRPWLDLPQSLLRHEAKRFKLSWVEDESNTDQRFDRNFMRHQVLPLLQQRWPETLNSLTQVAERARQTQQQLESWCQARLAPLLSARYRHEQALSLSGLAQFPLAEQHLLVRNWLHSLSPAQPPVAVFERLWTELIPADTDAQPELRWGDNRLRRFDDCLFYLAPEEVDQVAYHHVLELPPNHLPLSVELGRTKIVIHVARAHEAQLAAANQRQDACLLRLPKASETLVLRTRTGGERIRLPGARHDQTLKKILQEQHVPPWRRSQLPLLCYGEALAWVGCGLIADGFAAVEGQDALVVSCSGFAVRD